MSGGTQDRELIAVEKDGRSSVLFVSEGLASAGRQLERAYFTEAQLQDLERLQRQVRATHRRTRTEGSEGDPARLVRGVPDCTAFHTEAGIEHNDLWSAIESLDFTAVGKVEDATAGFYLGAPATLFSLVDVEVLKGGGDPNASPAELLIALPTGAVRIGDVTYCQELPGFDRQPVPGDTLLVISGWAPTQTRPLLNPAYQYLLFQGDDSPIRSVGPFEPSRSSHETLLLYSDRTFSARRSI